MIVIVAMSLGFDPSRGSSEEIVGTVSGEESVLGPTVTLPTVVPTTTGQLLAAPTDVEPGSSLSTRGLDRSIRPVVSQTLPTRAVSTTAASTTAAPATSAPTTQGTVPPTTAPPATVPSTTTTAAPTTTAPPTTTTTLAPTTTTSTTTVPPTTRPPSRITVNGDGYEVKSGKGVKFEILENDGDPALLDEDTLQIVAGPAHAEKYRVHNDHIHYESDDDFEGTDSLRYRVCTFDGACGTATVTIRVIDD
jgi:hypothetical protein